MITEQKKLTLSELASVCSILVKAVAAAKSDALFFHGLFNSHVDADPESMMPYSPIVEFYENMTEFYVAKMHSLESRIRGLEDIANQTMFAGLDY